MKARKLNTTETWNQIDELINIPEKLKFEAHLDYFSLFRLLCAHHNIEFKKIKNIMLEDWNYSVSTIETVFNSCFSNYENLLESGQVLIAPFDGEGGIILPANQLKEFISKNHIKYTENKVPNSTFDLWTNLIFIEKKTLIEISGSDTAFIRQANFENYNPNKNEIFPLKIYGQISLDMSVKGGDTTIIITKIPNDPIILIKRLDGFFGFLYSNHGGKKFPIIAENIDFLEAIMIKTIVEECGGEVEFSRIN